MDLELQRTIKTPLFSMALVLANNLKRNKNKTQCISS